MQRAIDSDLPIFFFQIKISIFLEQYRSKTWQRRSRRRPRSWNHRPKSFQHPNPFQSRCQVRATTSTIRWLDCFLWAVPHSLASRSTPSQRVRVKAAVLFIFF